MAKDPENWVKEDFELWIDNGCHPTTASAKAASTNAALSGTTTANVTVTPVAVCPDTKKATTTAATTTTAPMVNTNRIISKDDKNSNLDDVAATATADATVDAYWKEERSNPTMLTDSNPTHGINIPNDGEIILLPLVSSVYQLEQSDDIDNEKSPLIGDLDGITAPVVVSTESVPNEEKIQNNTVAVQTTEPKIVSNKEVVSNLNVVVVDDDEIDNAKSTPGCENLIRELDGSQDEYYQVKRKYGSIYERYDVVNPPSLPPESPSYAIWEKDANANLTVVETLTAPVSCTDIVAIKSVSSNLNVATAATDDDNNDNYDNLNAKLKLDGENSIGNLNGIQQEYLPGEYYNLDEYVNAYNSTTDKTKLIILETHQVNNNDDDILNADIQCNGFFLEEEYSIGFAPGKPDNSIDNEANVGKDGVPDDNYNYCVIYDRNDDANRPPFPPESNMPCIHSIIGEVNEEFQFWTDIPNREPYGDNGNTYNDPVLNQADYNIPNNRKSILICSLEDLDCRNSEVSTNNTVLEQSNEVNTLFDEVNEEYSF